MDSDLTGSDAQWNRFYDVFAPLYELNERFFGWAFTGLHMRAEQARMVASLGIKSGCSLLEICTGPGVFQPLLAQAIGTGGRIVALDLSMGMLRQCARRTRQQRPVPLVVQANGDNLPFADASFDYLFHFGAIKLFTSPEKALLECARVLRPGARLFLGDEGFEPTIPKKGWRRQLLMRLSPGFRKPPPELPNQLKLIERKDVYDGLAFLWTLERIET
jgi:ubiquinone/menaquinone biosynthesis C-methylase UbiE